ncbi:MAG: hypothetical protein WBD47_21375 [Phormidesmis sp.]
MLAYSTVSSLIQIPSAIEVAVYMVGLVAVVALPSLLFSLSDRRTNQSSQKREQKAK